MLQTSFFRPLSFGRPRFTRPTGYAIRVRFGFFLDVNSEFFMNLAVEFMVFMDPLQVPESVNFASERYRR